MKIHIVKKGDTLWKIAQKYNADFETIKKINTHIKNPDKILPGMKVKVPTNGVQLKNDEDNKELPIKETPVKEKPVKEKPVMPEISPQPKSENSAVNPITETDKDINIQMPSIPTKEKPVKEMPIKEIPKEKPVPVPMPSPMPSQPISEPKPETKPPAMPKETPTAPVQITPPPQPQPIPMPPMPPLPPNMPLP
ncbi:SafA/ExsA family spore coat assembly protein, partial [Aneurinibacillus aneurinilyticus]